MEEKKVQGRYDRIRTIFSNWGNNHNFFRRQVGFTLVELLVVVGIIGILSVAVLATLNPLAQIQKGNDTKRKGDLSQIQKALETYYHDNGGYPKSSGNYRIIFTGNVNGNPADWGSNGFSPYMNKLPSDPSKDRIYVYFSSGPNPQSPQSYWLYASLERDKSCTNGVCVALDPQLCNKGDACTSLATNGVPSSACGGTCNFGISSSNTSP